MANLLKTEDEQYKTGATYDGDEGELVVTPKRVLFESNDRNTKIHVGLKDVVGVEMMREPVDWGATLVGIPLLLAAYASFIATQLMPPELTGVLFAVGGVCGLGGLGLVIYAVLRSRVLTIRTAGEGYEFDDADAGDADKVANAVQHYTEGSKSRIATAVTSSGSRTWVGSEVLAHIGCKLTSPWKMGGMGVTAATSAVRDAEGVSEYVRTGVTPLPASNPAASPLPQQRLLAIARRVMSRENGAGGI